MLCYYQSIVSKCARGTLIRRVSESTLVNWFGVNLLEGLLGGAL